MGDHKRWEKEESVFGRNRGRISYNWEVIIMQWKLFGICEGDFSENSL